MRQATERYVSKQVSFLNFGSAELSRTAYFGVNLIFACQASMLG
jgi:hypothetical protein